MPARGESRLAPPTIYRALAALTDRGSVHRLESLNAFIACQHDRHRQASILSICNDCGGVEENVSTELLKGISNNTHLPLGNTVDRIQAAISEIVP